MKALVLLGVALGAFALLGRDPSAVAERLVARVGLDRESDVVEAVLERVPGLTPPVLAAVGGGAIAYALLFLTEAYGLFRGRVWAEWLTLVATASFVPLELAESIRRLHAWKVATLVANVAIVGYLAWRRVHLVDGRLVSRANG